MEGLSADDEQKLIESDARREWDEAGYDPASFTMGAYNDLITSEQIKDKNMLVRLDDLRGVNNLPEKQAIVEVKRARSTVRRLIRFGEAEGALRGEGRKGG